MVPVAPVTSVSTQSPLPLKSDAALAVVMSEALATVLPLAVLATKTIGAAPIGSVISVGPTVPENGSAPPAMANDTGWATEVLKWLSIGLPIRN